MECPRCGGDLDTYSMWGRETQACSQCNYVGVPVEHQSDRAEPETWSDAISRFYEKHKETADELDVDSVDDDPLENAGEDADEADPEASETVPDEADETEAEPHDATEDPAADTEEDASSEADPGTDDDPPADESSHDDDESEVVADGRGAATDHPLRSGLDRHRKHRKRR